MVCQCVQIYHIYFCVCECLRACVSLHKKRNLRPRTIIWIIKQHMYNVFYMTALSCHIINGKLINIKIHLLHILSLSNGFKPQVVGILYFASYPYHSHSVVCFVYCLLVFFSFFASPVDFYKLLFFTAWSHFFFGENDDDNDDDDD